MTANTFSNRKTAIRFSIISVLVVLVNTLVGCLSPHPFPWVVIIPMLLPVLVVAFIVVPQQKTLRK